MNPQRGEVWLADLGLAAKTRPVIVVSPSTLTLRFERRLGRLPASVVTELKAALMFALDLS